MNTIRPQQLSVLSQALGAMGRALEMDRALGGLLDVLGGETRMGRGLAALRDEETGRLAIVASRGLSSGEREAFQDRLGQPAMVRLLQSGRPFVLPPGLGEPVASGNGQADLSREGADWVGAPVGALGQGAGLLLADRLSEDNVPLQEDLLLMGLLADLAGAFLEAGLKARAREEALSRENLSLRARLSQGYQRFQMVGRSEPMTRVHQMIEKVAPTRATVLLLGEPGTGKTLVARMIHELSERARHPFVKVSCALVPENLLEAELFGSEKGAAGAAAAPRPGRLEEADRGTVYLDEVGRLTPAVQAKLCRFLQEREFERVGGVRTRKADARVVASTNMDLGDLVSHGLFREDLFYRLNAFPVAAPALRERPGDIPSLLNHFLEKLSREFGRRLTFSPRALDALVKYDWPGNVRELENLVERLSITVKDERIDLGDVPPHFFSAGRPAQAQAAPEGQGSLKDMEKREVMAALERHNWVQSRAARELGLTLRQMGYRIKKFGLEAMVNERRGREQAAEA